MILIILFFPVLLLAAEWESVTPADWQIGIADEWKDANAVMLFEKIIIDDSKAPENIFTTTLYRRVKILNPRGYLYADVAIPYLHNKQKVRAMRGRTLWPNGRIFNLDKRDIFGTDLLSMKKLAVKQKAFSLPGVQDGCIVEYMFTYESPTRISQLDVQKEMPLLQFELSWYFYNYEIPYGLVMARDARKELESILTTPYIRSYNLSAYEFLQPGSAGNQETNCLKFKARNLAAYKDEPLAVHEVYSRGGIMLYYNKRSGDYWSEMAENLWSEFEKFSKSRSRFDILCDQFDGIKNPTDYLQSVYDWIAQNISNTDYNTRAGEEAKKIESLDDILVNHCGSSIDINLLFYFLAKQRNLKPEICFVSDRRKNIVDRVMPEWQFDESLILIPIRLNTYRPYMPGTRCLQAGRVPFYYEGTTGFAVDSITYAWRTIPFSTAPENCTKRMLALELAQDGTIAGRYNETSNGQVAWSRRSAIAGLDSATAVEELRNALWDVMPQAGIDSIRWQNADSLNKNMIMSCNVTFPRLSRYTGNTCFIQPTDYFGRTENRLFAETRKTQILLDYASDVTEILKFTPIPGWQVLSLPIQTRYPHLVGNIDCGYSEVGGSVSMQRHVTIGRPFWVSDDYRQLQKFMQQRSKLNNELIVLTR